MQSISLLIYIKNEDEELFLEANSYPFLQNLHTPLTTLPEKTSLKKIMIRILTIVSILSFHSVLESKDLAETVILEEQFSSGSGEIVSSKRKFMDGENYTNKTGKYVKLYFTDKAVVSLGSKAKFTLPSKAQRKKQNISLIVDDGISRFNVKNLKQEEFKIRLPSAVVGVRGTKFAIYLDKKSEVKLLTGSIDVKDLNENKVILKPSEKVLIDNGALQPPMEMGKEEFTKELKLLESETTFYFPGIEEAIEKYHKEMNKVKSDKSKAQNAEAEAIKREIDKEIEKAKRKNDQNSIQLLEKLKENFKESTEGYPKIDRYIEVFYKHIEANDKKYTPKERAASARVSKIFDKEIKQAIRNKDMGVSDYLQNWKQEVVHDCEYKISHLDDKRGTVWLPKLSKRPSKITFTFVFNTNKDDIITCFSKNKLEYQKGADALTCLVSAKDTKFTLRSEMFKGLEGRLNQKPFVNYNLGKEHFLSFEVNETMAIYSVDGEVRGSVAFDENSTLPMDGYFGLLKVDPKNFQIRDITITP